MLVAFLFSMTVIPVNPQPKNIQDRQNLYGGILVWGVCHKPTLINPVLTTTSISASLIPLIFNGLVRINAKGEIEPDLAQSWDISADGLTYTFYLRKGVKFHDGKECTAYDVKFTYDTIVDPKTDSPYRTSFHSMKSITVIDPYTVKILLRKPSAPLLYRLTKEILPAHLFENSEARKNSFNFCPVGTGPFKFKQWIDDGLILEYNPDYYEGRPYLDEIVVKTYPDSGAVWTALMRGEIDFCGFIEREDYEVVKDDPVFKTYTFPSDGYYTLIYNLNDPVLGDKKVREAIACGVDKKSLIERVAGGYGVECSGPFYPGTLGYNPSLKPVVYNPEKAMILLKEAGWDDYDHDGVLEKEGEKLELKVLVDERNEIFKRMAMVLRQQLQEMGIKLSAILYNDIDMLVKEEITERSPNAQITFLLAGIDPDQQQGDWCSESKRGDKLWAYKNNEVDRLFSLGEVTRDRKEREKMYRKIHRLICQDQPVCFLYFPFVFHALLDRFESTDEYFNVNMPDYTIKDWRIRKDAGKFR